MGRKRDRRRPSRRAQSALLRTRLRQAESLALAQSPRDQPGEAVGKTLGVARPLAVAHAGLVIQKVRGVLLEGFFLVAQLRQRGDEAVARIDLQDWLGDRHDAARALQ